jgi:hypothetical protein
MKQYPSMMRILWALLNRKGGYGASRWTRSAKKSFNAKAQSKKEERKVWHSRTDSRDTAVSVAN